MRVKIEDLNQSVYGRQGNSRNGAGHFFFNMPAAGYLHGTTNLSFFETIDLGGSTDSPNFSCLVVLSWCLMVLNPYNCLYRCSPLLAWKFIIDHYAKTSPTWPLPQPQVTHYQPWLITNNRLKPSTVFNHSLSLLIIAGHVNNLKSLCSILNRYQQCV